MIRPRTSARGSWVSICCIARLQHMNTPRRFTFIIASQSSGSVASRSLEWVPRNTALVMITSSRPVSATAVEIRLSMSAHCETSVSM